VKRLAFVAAVTVAIALAGCSASDGIADKYGDKTDKGYLTGEGWNSYPADTRTDAVSYESETDEGAPVSSKDYLGEVVVINFWYAACVPCRVEAPILESLNTEYADQGVQVLGVNTRDSADTAKGFAEKFGVSYPSLLDVDSGNVLFAFAGVVPANATPTTLVIDKKGRVAARISGQLDGRGLLDGFIKEALAEDA